jgi:hypothetical protein
MHSALLAWAFMLSMNNTRTKEQKAQEREAARQAREKALTFQAQGYGFSHDIPARGIPAEIMEMAGHMAPGSGRRGQVTEQGLTLLRRRMREARI